MEEETKQGISPQITQETFTIALRLIREQDEINRQFSKSLDIGGNGHFAFGCDNKYLEALLLILKEALHDQYDYIGWWLYEAAPDYKIWTQDSKKEWCLKEPADLYEFIVYECC